MSDPFHNPYHFVPYGDVQGSPDKAPLIRKGGSLNLHRWPEHLTHARFVSGTHSGRLVCRITICELLALGGQQTESDKGKKTPRKVQLFKLGEEWALPGSSLRGLLSSIAETASNSALRVLENKPLSISGGQAGRKQLGHPHDYFPTELLPLALNRERSCLSLAEQMFGVVEDVPDGTKKPEDWKAFTLASRLRFSNALAFGIPVRQAAVGITQILDSPKPQSHNMYFEPKSGAAYIPKTELNPGRHKAKGRKFYLHQQDLQKKHCVTQNPSDSPHQKAEVAPMSQGQFWFHVDFDNLTDIELALLCYSVRPSPDFRHKLGMGKPLGLGKIEMEPMGLFLIDRHKRYSAPSADRYHYVWRRESEDSWPAKYQREAKAQGQPASSPAERAAFYKQSVPDLQPILEALELIGQDSSEVIPHPVHYPQVALRYGKPLNRDSAGFETELYKWFVENDRPGSGRHHLGSLIGQKSMPTLERDPQRPSAQPAKASGQTPPQNTPSSKPTTPFDLEGRVISFTVKETDPAKNKLKFQCSYEEFKHLGGSLTNAQETQKLLASGIQTGQTINLLIKKYNQGHFQLSLPQT